MAVDVPSHNSQAPLATGSRPGGVDADVLQLPWSASVFSEYNLGLPVLAAAALVAFVLYQAIGAKMIGWKLFNVPNVPPYSQNDSDGKRRGWW